MAKDIDIEEYLKGLGIETTSDKIHARDVDVYRLADDEELSDDGDAILCKNCGGVRAVKKYSQFFKKLRWEIQTCECRMREKWERNVENDKKKFPEIIKKAYDDPDYVYGTIGSALKDIQWDDPKFTGPTQYDSFVNAKNRLKEFCIKYELISESKCGWYLYSPTRGNGKTTLAGMVRNELLHMGVSCVVVTMERLSSLKIEQPTLFYKMATARCLIIDDIGVNPYNDWKNQVLYDLMCVRASDDAKAIDKSKQKYVTCFTSNYAINDLTRCNVSSANISRIQGACGATIKIDTPTRRGR